jgi:hypothetical protein
MMELKELALLVGSVTAVAAAPCVISPGKAREWIRGFPRSRAAGVILSAVCVAWATWSLFQMPLAWFDRYKPSLYVLAPLLYFLVVTKMDELLAPRALGGLFILVPAPVLEIARQRAIVLVSFMYILAVAGIALMLSPYVLRKVMAYWIETDGRCRALGYAGIALGVFVAVFGLVAY